MNDGRPLAWFWNFKGVVMFVGYAGGSYPGCKEIEPCPCKTKESACDVFTRSVAPWQASLIPPGKVPVLHYKRAFEPPK